MSSKTATVLIAVYRQHQETLYSPCVTESMCGICAAHLRGKKKNTPCLMLASTAPAFDIPLKTASGLISDGLAKPVNWQEGKGYTAIQLLFSRLAHLRDSSCKVDEAMLIAYAEGRSRARAAMDGGWQGIRITSPDGVNQVSLAQWTPEQMAASEERIQSFV